MTRWLFAFLLAWLWFSPAQAVALKAENQLLSAQTVVVAGSTVQLAIQQKLPPGWHTYAQDPGDVGQSLTMQWLSPATWQISKFSWPPVETIITPPNLISHIYKNKILLPFTAHIPNDATIGPVTLQAKIDYLICAATCIPETAGLSLPLQIGDIAVASAEAQFIQQAHSSIFPWWILAGTALLAGLLMNLMPCVLPLLLIKTTSLLQAPYGARKALMAYIVGLFTSLYIMLAIIYLARSILHTNFGFEFLWQSKIFIEILIGIILISAIWVISGTPFIRLSLTSKSLLHPYFDHFIMGALGMLLALPCTGPLLGPLLFTAFGQNSFSSFIIFTCLGLGYALPIILLLLIPSWRRYLPKPGPWLRYMRYVMASILVASAIWLFSLLPNAHATQHSVLSDTVADVTTALATNDNVFVDVTADWCLTCKFNEWHVIDTHTIQNLFKANQVKTFRLDWTNRNPAITAFLASYQRVGIPLYVWYHHGEPAILPQILTLDDLQQQLSR